MTEIAAERDRLPKPTLQYPFEQPPEPGTALEVAPGVVWMRMPLPMMLNHINIWGIEDGDGWAIVDTGMRTDETLAAWRAAVRQRHRRQEAQPHLLPRTCTPTTWAWPAG